MTGIGNKVITKGVVWAGADADSVVFAANWYEGGLDSYTQCFARWRIWERRRGGEKGGRKRKTAAEAKAGEGELQAQAYAHRHTDRREDKERARVRV